MKQLIVAMAVLLAACATRNTPAPAEHRDPVASSPLADPGAPLLHPDEFDAPAPVSVAESAKTVGSADVPSAGPPTSRSARAGGETRPEHHSPEIDGGGEHTGHGDTAALYVCPMHPDVTSSAPGNCPKCGMTLVKKEKP
jgi:hypothetical protein